MVTVAKIVSVERRLKQAVHDRLAVLGSEHEDLEVAWHLTFEQSLSYHQAEEEDETPSHFAVTPRWMLSLYFTRGEREMALFGMVPYQCCIDGDPEAIVELCDRVWGRFVFADLMDGTGLDESMDKIAAEAEKGQ